MMSIQFDPKQSTSQFIQKESVVQMHQPFLYSSITQNADEIENSSCYETFLDCVLKIWDWILSFLGCGEKKKEELPKEDKKEKEKPKPTENVAYPYENSAHPDPELAALDRALKNPRQFIRDLKLSFANSETYWIPNSDWRKIRDPDGNTLLYILCYCEGNRQVNGFTISFKMIQHLIERGADPKALNGAGNKTVWHFVQSVETAKILFQYAPDLIDQPDTNLKGTPLHFAVRGNNVAVVQFLLDKVNIRALDATASTAFHDVQSVEVAELLLVRDPTLVDLKNSSLETPLHRLCYHPFFHRSTRKKEIVNLIKFLIERGVDKNARDKKGKTAFDNAHPELIRMLNENEVIK